MSVQHGSECMKGRGMDNVTLDEFFREFPDSRPIFDAAYSVAAELGPIEVRVSKSEIAFLHKRVFARFWIPDRYLHGGHAPLVMTVGYRHKDQSTRWKEIVEPKPGRFTHHLELMAAQEVDDEVRGWLWEAWKEAA